MKRFKGVGASEGVAIGPARLLTARLVVVDRFISHDLIGAEVQRLEDAIEATDRQLVQLSRRLEVEGSDEGRLIVEAHRLMLTNDELAQGARVLVERDGLQAESAVRRAVDAIVAIFDKMADPYLRERGGDVEAVGERLLATLLGLPEVWSGAKVDGAIGVGAVLSPVDAFHLSRAGLVGIVTERGGKTSHAAIIVRALELPYVFGVKDLCGSVSPGDTLLVDGGSGEVIVSPDEATIRLFQDRLGRERERTRRSRSMPTGTTRTSDGVREEIAANIEALSEVTPAIELGAESIGLFRTELLYLDRLDLPTEEEQYRDAVEVMKKLGGRSATFRTLDLGGDKLPPGLKLPEEANPSLGIRGIRFSLRRRDIFDAQLRALYRASEIGPLRIMFPLVSGIAELKKAQVICAQIREQLRSEGVSFNPLVPIGAMIETPSAALTTDHLAECCDFLSIGTNDLIQYAFAADRDNQEVGHLYHPLHPAVLRLLKNAIDGAARAGKPISVCGDMAGDPSFIWVLLGLGVRELSMAPRQIPAVRSMIAATCLIEAQDLATEVLRLHSDTDVEELVLSSLQRRFGSIDEPEQASRAYTFPSDRVVVGSKRQTEL